MRMFGTDGVRGIANTELTPEIALALGRAAVTVLASSRSPVVFVGRDTRRSGDLLVAALAAGCMSAGADVVDLGVVPTPALAYLTRCHHASVGAMVSASHNPAIDNGIKFFSQDGYKLPDEVEDAIEATIRNGGALSVAGDRVGVLRQEAALQEDYLAYLKRVVPVDLTGLKIVVDAANGAAFALAPALFTALGATVIPLNVSPDGLNINVDAGSTHPRLMVDTVRAESAHLGLAFDGDADRLIACDSQGRLVDGDNVLHICASSLQANGLLPQATVVGTVMSNLGLDAVLRRKDIKVRRAQVGDRYVLAEMQKSGAVLGGEQSGHCIFLASSTTGDGLLTALMLLQTVVEQGIPLDAWLDEFRRYPQVLLNIAVSDKHGTMKQSAVREAIMRAEATLGETGRILVRPSGTEACVRVMVEAPDEAMANLTAEAVAATIRSASA
ncbi:MAG: Phosphoglucosamine mutase [Firmicutes bacterium]|nr:Phosphoglucosamine mutase [candidate division NPL-UPA2 bacterium]